ncbi:MAG TPA: sigma-70 family RNA polymerase sigma factor, partial [Myxococcota bacterium]|nr:sigma-70 family RNA polymerase sigma factor [Myxococcota bacterium]
MNRSDSSTVRPVALMTAVRNGEPGAAAMLFDGLAPRIRRLLRRACGATHDLDDLVQDCFLKLWKSIGRLKDPERLDGFVYAIAVHTARSALRKRYVRRILRIDTAVVEEVGDAYSGTVEQRERARVGAAVLDGLSPELRLAFVLRHVEELDLQEGAEALGVSLSTFKR